MLGRRTFFSLINQNKTPSRSSLNLDGSLSSLITERPLQWKPSASLLENGDLAQVYWRMLKRQKKFTMINTRKSRSHRDIFPFDCLSLLTLGAHAHSEGYSSCRVCMYVCVYVCVYVHVCTVCVCVCVCVTTHNCRLTHWNHKTEIPTCSQQYSDRFKICRFS